MRSERSRVVSFRSLRLSAGVLAAVLVWSVAWAQSVDPADAAEEPVPAEADTSTMPPGVMEYRTAGPWQRIYRSPGGRSPIRGTLVAGESFAVVEHVRGANCKGDTWAALEDGGYTCLHGTEPTDEVPVMQPRLVAFDQPRPEEYYGYIEHRTYDRDPVAESELLLPFIYGKVWRKWRAPFWRSLSAWNSGRRPEGNLSSVPKYHFVEAIDTPRGTVLRRRDGSVTPADEVFIYPVDRFKGRDLAADPVPEGQTAAWVIAYDGVEVRSDPRPDAPVMATMEFHTPLTVDTVPVQGRGTWWRIPDALMPGVDGWVPAGTNGVRVMELLARPDEVGTDELWVDVDTRQQVLTLRRGDRTLYATLVSTGEGARWATPTGLYRVYDKSVHGDMKSRDDAEEPYHVEKVPWVMHFKTRYALHGVFWHWGFGHRASHGCVNLSPHDARYLFERVGPQIGRGWHTTYATPEDLGTHMRVHNGSAVVRDRRVAVK